MDNNHKKNYFFRNYNDIYNKVCIEFCWFVHGTMSIIFGRKKIHSRDYYLFKYNCKEYNNYSCIFLPLNFFVWWNYSEILKFKNIFFFKNSFLLKKVQNKSFINQYFFFKIFSFFKIECLNIDILYYLLNEKFYILFKFIKLDYTSRLYFKILLNILREYDKFFFYFNNSNNLIVPNDFLNNISLKYSNMKELKNFSRYNLKSINFLNSNFNENFNNIKNLNFVNYMFNIIKFNFLNYGHNLFIIHFLRVQRRYNKRRYSKVRLYSRPSFFAGISLSSIFISCFWGGTIKSVDWHTVLSIVIDINLILFFIFLSVFIRFFFVEFNINYVRIFCKIRSFYFFKLFLMNIFLIKFFKKVNLSRLFNSKLILNYYTYISPYAKEEKILQLYHYHYFCCYLWILKEMNYYSSLKFVIKVNRLKYVSLVKAPKCHKKGKYTFWYKSYKILVFFFDFLSSSNVNLEKILELFNYLNLFYNSLSSNILFQKKLLYSQSCFLDLY